MAGGHMKYRTLSRDSAHRQALLRNIVTTLIRNETLHTTWHKAKEAQRIAEKLITLAKRDNEETRRKAQAILYMPDKLMPKLFGEIKDRYATRTGGYTRVLLTEPKKHDTARSAILELVDGPRDMRFAMTAAAIARDRALGRKLHPLTRKNMKKVTQFRPNGMAELEEMIAKTAKLNLSQKRGVEDDAPETDKEGWADWEKTSTGAPNKITRRSVNYDASRRNNVRRVFPYASTEVPRMKKFAP